MNTLTSISFCFVLSLSAFGCAATTGEIPSGEETGMETADLSAGVAAFDALSEHDKLNALYEDFREEAWSLELKDGFKQTPTTIAQLPDAVAAVGESTLQENRDLALENGGDAKLFVIKKGRSTYAYVIEARGRSWGNWASTQVFDRKFVAIGGFAAAD